MNKNLKEYSNIITLVHNEPNVTLPVFATENFLKSKSTTFGWFVNDDFILPFLIEKKMFFKRLIFTTETIYLKKELTIQDETSFLNDMVAYCKKENVCDFIYKAQANAVFNTVPKGSDSIEWGSYESKLDTTIKECFSQFRSKDRNTIRKAIKLGVEFKQTEKIEKVYENIKETFQRQNSLFYPDLEYLKKLEKNLKNNIAFFVVEEKNNIQGSAIIIYNKERAFYLYGGSSPRPLNGSLNLLHYKILDFCYQNNIKYYDLMGARLCMEQGSKFEAIQKFKSRFGNTLKRGYAFRVIIHPLKFKLFTLLAKSYFKLKGSQYIDPIDSIRRCVEEQHTNNA